MSQLLTNADMLEMIGFIQFQLKTGMFNIGIFKMVLRQTSPRMNKITLFDTNIFNRWLKLFDSSSSLL